MQDTSSYDHSTPRAAPADRLLARLTGLRRTGAGRWVARCPAHDDRRPSLSVRIGDDGAMLIYCFAGCPAGAIVAALGLSLADLFFDRSADRRPPRRGLRGGGASDALAAIDREALLVAVIAADLHRHREIDDATWRRLVAAAARIGAAREAVR